VNKEWRLITGFAVFGLVVAAFFFILIGVLGIVDGTLYTAMVVLCPASLLSIPFSEAMKDKSGFYSICSLIVFLNSGLYAVIGAAVVGLRRGSRTKCD
jgi:hypothetical protein